MRVCWKTTMPLSESELEAPHAAAVAFYAVYRGREENVAAACTAAFVTLAMSQLMFSFG
jgi:hypothetical protein